MLVIRRRAGQGIVLLGSHIRCNIKILRLNNDSNSIAVKVDGVGRHTMKKGDMIKFLQGDGQIKFRNILTYSKYPPEAVVVIRVPQEIAIYREELLTGLNDGQISELLR